VAGQAQGQGHRDSGRGWPEGGRRRPGAMPLDVRLERRLTARAAGGRVAWLIEVDRDLLRPEGAVRVDTFDRGYGHGV